MDFNIFEGLECHGVPLIVISQGRVVVDHGKVSGCHSYLTPLIITHQVEVVRGSGRYIPRKPFSEIVYSRVLQRDKVWVPKAVEREPYSGPVIQLPPQ